MTPEDRVNLQIWEILQDIKEEILSTPNDLPVKYRIPNVVGVGVIAPERRRKLLYKLESEDAFKIQRNSDGQRIGTGELFYLIINRKVFNKVYTHYQKLAQEQKNSKTEDTSTTRTSQIRTNVANIPTEIVIADLKYKYEEIENEQNHTQFFIKTAQYGEYIQKNRSTVLLLNPLYQEAKDDAHTYTEAWKKFIDVWKTYASDILYQAEQAGIKDDPNVPSSNEIYNLRIKLNASETSVWETDLGDYFIPYQSLVWKFNALNKSELLIPKHFDPENKILHILPVYHQARDTWDKFNYTREAKAWWAHYQICRLAAGVLDLKEGSEYFKGDNVIDNFYKFEFDEVARGNINRSPIVLHPNKYLTWIKRLHAYLIPRLEYQINFKQKNIHKPVEPIFELKPESQHNDKVLFCGKLKLDIAQGVVQFGTNNPVEVSPNENKIKLLKVLLETKKAVEYAEIAKKLEMNCWHEGVTNGNVAREVQFVRRDLAKFLIKEIGMTEKELQDMLITKKGFGYKLRFPENSPIAH